MLSIIWNNNCIIDKTTNVLVRGSVTTIIPEYITKIGRYVFSNLNGLQSIVIPANIMLIQSEAFVGCSNLTNITLEVYQGYKWQYKKSNVTNNPWLDVSDLTPTELAEILLDGDYIFQQVAE